MIRNILTNFSARLGVAALNFLIMLLTVNYLGMESRGEISKLMLGIGIIHLVSDLAGGPSLVYLVPRMKIRSLIFTGTIWSICSAFITGYILVDRGMVPPQYQNELYIIGILISFHSLNQNILLGQERIRAFNLLFLFQGLVMFAAVCVGIFIFHQHRAYPYIHAAIAGNGIAYLLGLYLVLKKVSTIHISESRPVFVLLFTNGLFTQTASIGLQLCKGRNYSMIESKMSHGINQVGIFSTAFSLGEAIMLLAASISAIILSRVANNADPSEERIAVIRLGKLSFILTGLAILFFALLPTEFYLWLLGKESAGVKGVFLTVCPGLLALSFATVFSHYYSGAGKHYMNFISSVIAFTATYLLSGWFIDHLGIRGAGMTATIAYSLLSIFIFICFMLGRKKGKREWRILLPSRDDISFVKNFMNRKSGI